jgi:hypothetical protein
MRLSLFLLLVACSGSPSNPNTDGSTSDTGNNASDTGNGGGESAPPTCYEGCSTVADCALSVSAYDEDNYTCDGGACVYTGCNNDEECSFFGENYVCADTPGVAERYCQPSCTTVADCDLDIGTAYDADNYTCEAQVCRWQGCNSTAECVETLGSDYVCAATGGLDTCLLACSTPADCAQGSAATDADNYACEDGACVYTGCNSDTECEDAFGAGAQCQ